MNRREFLGGAALLAAVGRMALAASGGVQAAPVTLDPARTAVVTDGSLGTEFAVKELNEIVKKSTARAFAADSREKGRGKGEEGWHRIHIGIDPALGEEESAVYEKDGDVYLQGGDVAGMLWAVYDFVEYALDYHWYFMVPDAKRALGETYRKCERIAYDGVRRTRKPGFTGFRRDHENLGYYRLFRLRNRCNTELESFIPGYRYKYTWRTMGHGFNEFLPFDLNAPILKLKRFPQKVLAQGDVFAAHPEWFSLGRDGRRHRDMQLCLSNPGCRKALTQAVLWWIEAFGDGVYMVGSNDDYTGTYCFCEDCLALERKYGCKGGPMWDYVIELCDELKRRGLDRVCITSLAYRHQTQMAPLGCTFPDNFICDYAPVCWDRAPCEMSTETVECGRTYDWDANMKAWGRCAKNLSYWYYGSSNAAFAYGRMEKELNEIYAAGIRSCGLCGREGGPEFGDMMHSLYFWKLFNPSGSARARMLEMCRVKYGPAADGIMTYVDSLERLRQRMVKATPDSNGSSAQDPFLFMSKDEVERHGRFFDDLTAQVKGTPYEQKVAWARLSLDVRAATAFGDKVAAARAEAAAKSWGEACLWPNQVDTKSNRILQKLNQFAYYGELKSDDLPPELQKYPKGKVTRILPAKEGPYQPFSAIEKGRSWSVPDPKAACGHAMSDVLPEGYANGDARNIRIGVYNHGAGRYELPFNNVMIPKDFWSDREYRLFRLGTCKLAPQAILIWTDTKGDTRLSRSPLDTHFLSRCYDSVEVDKKYEIWLSLKAEGPMFFDGDTRENRVFIEQLFVVDLGK